MRRRPIREWSREKHGSAMTEFALTLPLLLTLVLGLVYGSLMVFSYSSLHFAAEEAARCFAINYSSGTAPCGSAADTQTYASTRYNGYGSDATFVANASTKGSPAGTATCGYQVTGTLNFAFNFFVRTVTVPLSATACFPSAS